MVNVLELLAVCGFLLLFALGLRVCELVRAVCLAIAQAFEDDRTDEEKAEEQAVSF